MGIPAEETAFVGDEIKDMQCAKGAGAKAVLINRTGERKDYGQDDTGTGHCQLFPSALVHQFLQGGAGLQQL